jgi:hypothetical protein
MVLGLIDEHPTAPPTSVAPATAGLAALSWTAAQMQTAAEHEARHLDTYNLDSRMPDT